MTPLHFRSIFISDVHMGTADCQAELLLEFLESTTSDSLYLVGDIFDFWKIRHGMVWPRVKNQLVNLVLDKARAGTRVVYVPGNHDELMRDFVDADFNGVDMRRETVHKTADGKRLLIMHGDAFDDIVRGPRKLEFLGSRAYELIMWISRAWNRVRKRFGYDYWSFAAFIKYRFKEAVRYIETFEKAAAAHAGRLGFDGIVCGHIHHPNDRMFDRVRYLNTGDWVEHCTALTESVSGELTVIDWLSLRQELLTASPVPVRTAA